MTQWLRLLVRVLSAQVLIDLTAVGFCQAWGTLETSLVLLAGC